MGAGHGALLDRVSLVTGTFRQVQEPRVESGEAEMGEMAQQSRRACEQKSDTRPKGRSDCIANQSPKDERKAETADHEVARRKKCRAPGEIADGGGIAMDAVLCEGNSRPAKVHCERSDEATAGES